MEEKLICGSREDSTFRLRRSRLPLCFISALSGIHFPTVHQPLGGEGPAPAVARAHVDRLLEAEAQEVRGEL